MTQKLTTSQPTVQDAAKKDGNTKPLPDRLRDKERGEQIVEHLWCVWHYGKRFFQWGFDLGFKISDLIQTGTLGLIEAVDRHDPAKGPLPPYAKFYIENHIRRLLQTKGSLVKTPAEKGRAKVCDIEAVEPISVARDDAGIDELVAINQLPLSDRTKSILGLRISGMTEQKIGELLGISRQRISQIMLTAKAELNDEGADQIPAAKAPSAQIERKKPIIFDNKKSVYGDLKKRADIGKSPEEICDFLLKRSPYEIFLAFRKAFPEITNAEISEALKAETNHFSLHLVKGEYQWKWKYYPAQGSSMLLVGLAEHIDPPAILMETAEKIAIGRF